MAFVTSPHIFNVRHLHNRLLSIRSKRSSVPGFSFSKSARGKTTMTDVISINPNASEEQMAAALNPVFQANPAKFLRALAIVKHANRHTRPQFPTGIIVKNTPKIPQDDIPAFKEKYICNVKLKDYDSPEAKERLASNGRVTQYTRWNWALENLDTYMNMLRVCGHSDAKIQDMLAGIPMCLESRAAFDELRRALKELAEEIEEEMQWTNVGFVFTGSSVPGFSQNPMKGFKDLPSRITSPLKSDVDICIVADGINNAVARCHSDGDDFLEPKRAFPTTVNELSSGMRFGCKNIAEFCKSAAKFHEEWNAKLPGGLQFTFCEDDTDIPPWEARINIRDL